MAVISLYIMFKQVIRQYWCGFPCTPLWVWALFCLPLTIVQFVSSALLSSTIFVSTCLGRFHPVTLNSVRTWCFPNFAFPQYQCPRFALMGRNLVYNFSLSCCPLYEPGLSGSYSPSTPTIPVQNFSSSSSWAGWTTLLPYFALL